MRPSSHSPISFLVAALVVCLLVGCQCGDVRIGNVHPQIEASPASLDFGSTAPGSSVERAITLHNPSGASLLLSEVTVGGEAASVFSATPPALLRVAPGTSVSVRIVYSPTAEGNHSARLMVQSDASNAPEVLVPLAGTALSADLCAKVTCNQPPGPCFREAGTCAGGSCAYRPKDEGTACDDGNACTEGDVCRAGSCQGTAKACITPPAAACTGPNSFASYQSPGSCVGGVCQYPSSTVACSAGCANGVCQPAPCAGVTCNSPPPCFKGGVCVGGSCQYQPDVGASCDDGNACTTGDVCSAGGICGGAPRVCNTPPAGTCTGPNTFTSYQSPGSCAAGACQYAPTTVACAGGCTGNVCHPDPCTGVTCNSPPSCFRGGMCVGGSCQYQPNVGASCDDGNACTTGDSCSATGICGGAPRICSTPPPSTCLGAQTQRSYDAVGSCGVGGACSYLSHDVTCALGCEAATGRCRSTCPSGQHICQNQCVSDGSAATCGASCTACPNPANGNGQATCDGMRCGIQCNNGYVACPSGCCPASIPAWAQEAYLKASNTGAGDEFGFRVSLSADGSTLAVSTFREDSSATGVNGNQGDNSVLDSGAVYVFRRTSGVWAQEAYLKASNTGARDNFGFHVTLSADGSTLAVGAIAEDSNAIGVNGNQGDSSLISSGAAYVFRRTGGVWAQEAYLKASNTGYGDRFGFSVSLSADGSTLAVGAQGEWSNATGVNGNQGDNSASDSGAVYVFRRTGGVWAQEAYLKASNSGEFDYFGTSVSLSADGSTLAVGAHGEDSNAIGVNGNQGDNSALDSGAVYVFRRTGSVWAQEVYLKASNSGAGDAFGGSVSLSADGSTLAVGAGGEESNATGVNGNQGENSASLSGAAYVFQRTGSVWAQEAYLKASNTGAGDLFGLAVSLSADGGTLSVGAYKEASNATGVNGNQGDNSAALSGAVYVFRRTGRVWAQEAYLKASNTGTEDLFGYHHSLSPDGSTLAVGSWREDSSATGVNGNQGDNSATDSGAVYVFKL